MGPPKANLCVRSRGGFPEEGNLSTGRQDLRHLGVAAGHQSSVKFSFFFFLCGGRRDGGSMHLGKQPAWRTKRETETRRGEWRAESPRSIWRPLMQPQRIEHVLPGTGTVLPTTAGVSEVQDNRRAYSTMLLLPALRCCWFLASAAAAVHRRPCCGRQTMPAHTGLHTLHGEREDRRGVVGALLLNKRRGEEGAAASDDGDAGNPNVRSICDRDCWDMRRPTTKPGVPQHPVPRGQVTTDSAGGRANRPWKSKRVEGKPDGISSGVLPRRLTGKSEAGNWVFRDD
ncbi:hypothetical protein B0T14DRAFT_266346 [Immersiella caudata]|uniref:Uncharacterized protein n=1 Tax=Immersiella caudata TaxID=314043 RepID=A0AA39WL79_9PEZI|nr:hypothetical protein B0T14DRAFT_266346 [Immersiella caudata]